MGPKHQQSESKKRNKDREEFSDCDITDDEETRGIEHIAEEEHKENKDNLAENGPTNRRGKEDNVIENDTTATASVIETTPSTCSKPVSHQLPKICTQVFIIQLLISVICLLFANYIHVSYLHAQFHDKLKQEIVGMETLIEDAKTNIKGLQSNVVLINQTLDTLLSGTVQQLNKIQSDAELLLKERQTGLETNKDTVINIVMLLFTMLCVLSLLVYRLYQRPYGAVDLSRDSSRRSLNNMNSNAILNHIPSSPALERMLCIISFDEDRQRIHKMLLMSAGIKDDVKCHVIRRHNQIPDLPRCRVYIMCAEFTERHVIIEEQGLGLGDLHRTTYDAVHKLGGRLIILYTRDPGSRRLKDDQSYNNTIYCVTNQSELAVINMEGCFFSIYDTLNEGQKTRLKNKINQYLQ